MFIINCSMRHFSTLEDLKAAPACVCFVSSQALADLASQPAKRARSNPHPLARLASIQPGGRGKT